MPSDHFRFATMNGHVHCPPACLKRATNGSGQPQQRRPSFDHQVGAAKQRQRDGKAEGLGRLQIDDQLDLGGLLNWKIGRLFPLENPASVFSEQPVRLLEVRSIAHETASDRKLAEGVYGRYCMAGRQFNQLITLGQKKYLTTYHKRICS